MCGEIKKWQKARMVTVRLTTNGNLTRISLPVQHQKVQEVRLDEVHFTGFNGGASAGCYLKLDVQGMSEAYANNESRPGMLLSVDVLNPHTVYSRPKMMLESDGSTVQAFNLSIMMPNGTAATFTECNLYFTFVLELSAMEIDEFRAKRAMLSYPPTNRVDPRATDFRAFE